MSSWQGGGPGGGVEVARAGGGDFKELFAQDLSVGDGDHARGGEGADVVEGGGIAEGFGLEDGQAQGFGCELDSGRPGLAATSGGAVGLCDDGGDVMAVGDEALEGRDGEGWGADKDDGHRCAGVLRDSSMGATGRA